MYALQLEAVKDRQGKVEAYRAIIFERELYDGHYVASVHDVIESKTLGDLSGFFAYDYSDRELVTHVTTQKWGGADKWEQPDEITVWEAAEAVASFAVDLFDQDPLGVK